MDIKKQKYNLPIPELHTNDVIIFHVDGSYTLNEQHVTGVYTNGVPAIIVEEAIKSGDFSSLVDNKFLKVDSPQIRGLLQNVFDNIKRNNPGLKTFSFSILTLFAGVVEIWDLTQDRDRYKDFERKLLPRKLEEVEWELKAARESLETEKEFLEIYKLRNMIYSKRPSDEVFVSKEKEDIKMANGYTFYLRDLSHTEAKMLKIKKRINELKTKRDSISASADFKHYNLSGNGNIYTTMQTNLIGKYERIQKLMEQFNITPSSMSLESGELKKGVSASDGATTLAAFTSDKPSVPRMKDN